MAKQQIFERKKSTLDDYLSQLDELLKRNRGGGLYEGFDVNPRAFRIGGQVVDPSGLGQDAVKDQLRYTAYEPTTIPMEARLTQPDFNPNFDIGQEQDEDTIDFNSASGFKKVIDEITSIPVARTDDGGLLYSNGQVRYDDGRVRQATRADVPQVVRQFNDGSVLLTNGLYINPNASMGRGYSGLSGLSDLIFGRQQKVTQDYGNQNPAFYGQAGHRGTDFRTSDLEAGFNFAFPFEVEVMEVQRAESGSPYGNSLLLRLPNGSMLRLSHLDDMENFRPGNIVRAFDYIGTPGSTGQSTGEHLDVEYYGPDGQIANPEEFNLNMIDLVDINSINNALQQGQESLSDADKRWLEAQQDLISKGVNMTLDPRRFQDEERQEQPQQPEDRSFRQTIDENIIQPVTQAVQGVSEAMKPMSPERQALSRVPERIAQKTGLEAELGLSEGIAGQDAEQARIEGLAKQPKEYNPYRQLLGNVTERVGDFFGIPEGVWSETLAGGPTKRTNQALASQIGGEAPAQVPGIRQNIQDIGQDIARRAGEGINTLKEKASNVYQKSPLMGLFEGQKQVGDTKGSTLIDTSGGQAPVDNRDAFFKFGGVEQYKQNLLDNPDQLRGGALDTSLFKKDFFQDPNNIANVFGRTYMGKEATDKYKDYLGSNIKAGYDEPYKTELRVEDGKTYQYKIPVEQYFINQYYQDLLNETPDVLTSGFSYDDFQLPTMTRSASEFKGESPTGSRINPIFNTGALDLFKREGTKSAQLAGDLFKSPAKVYQGTTKSKTYEVPQASKSVFATPQANQIRLPALEKILVASGSKSSSKSSGSTLTPSLDKITPSISAKASGQLNKEQQQGLKVGSGTISTAPVKEAAQSAQLKKDTSSKSIFASAADWIKNLFKKK